MAAIKHYGAGAIVTQSSALVKGKEESDKIMLTGPDTSNWPDSGLTAMSDRGR
jgi:hypothetical protein